MNTATPLLIALCGVFASHAAAAQPCFGESSAAEERAHSYVTSDTATIEDVVTTLQGEYRSHAYVVYWHGSRVLILDPFGQTSKGVGDSITFKAFHSDVHGDRILMFASTEQAPPRTTGASAGTPSSQSSATTDTGVVEEVLSAQDNGFRYAAYIVISQGQQIAVSDVMALSHHVIGEQIDYVAVKSASPHPFLSFAVQLSAAEKASLSRPLCGLKQSLESGSVDQVLSANVDGYEYRAYVVEWRGSQIVVDDPTAETNYEAGDSVSFWVSRFSKSESITFDRPPQTTPVNDASDTQTSSAMDSVPIQAVLDSDVDGYRLVTYVVNWHNTSIAVDDVFANTHLVVGNRVTILVTRAASPNVKELRFMLRLPIRRCTKQPSSSDNSPPVATGNDTTGDCHS